MIDNGWRDHNGKPDDRWGSQIEGAAAEMAVAKHLNVFWDGGMDNFMTWGDVGGYEVRLRLEEDKDLYLNDRDESWKVFICVTGCIPTFKLWGWCHAEDGQTAE